jgi:hypothetical protein
MLPYRCAQRARASSQILQQSSRSSTLVHTKLTEGRHHAGVQLRAAAASGQAPLLPPAASSCSAPPAWQPLHCEEPRSQLRRHGGAGGHCDGRRGRPRPDLKNPSTTVGAPSPCAASTDHGEGRCGLSYYVKVFHQLLPHVTRLYPVAKHHDHRQTQKLHKHTKQPSAQPLLKLWQKATSEFATCHTPPQLPRAARMQQQSTTCEGHGCRHVRSTEHAHAKRRAAARRSRRRRRGQWQARWRRAPCSSRRRE